MHAEILTDTQVEVLRTIAPFARGAGFYLSGGTAVALHLGHRRSLDFDWFAPVDFDPDDLEERLLALLPRPPSRRKRTERCTRSHRASS
jgi:hypothetical protein